MSDDDTAGPDDDDAVDMMDGYVLPKPSPELQEKFDKIDALFAGLTRDQALIAVRGMYIDADGNPRLRNQNLRAVPGDSDVAPAADTDAAAGPRPVEDAVRPVRDIDTLTPEDRERGKRNMGEVRETLAQRKAERAAGVVDLGRERLLRLRRRRGLPTPD